MQIKVKQEVFRCVNCGANEFIYKDTLAVCEYCNSQYTVQNAEPVPEVAPTRHTPTNKNSTMHLNFTDPEPSLQAKHTAAVDYKSGVVLVLRVIFGVIFAIVFLTVLFSFFEQNQGRNISTVTHTSGHNDGANYNPTQVGMKYITLVGNWTREVYENIQVAQRQMTGEGVSFAHGDTFAVLESIVGRPSSTSYFYFDGRKEVTALWNSDRFESHYISISITYDEESDYIIRKNITGIQNLFNDDTISSAAVGLRNINEVPGWSEEIFLGIEIATTHWGDFSGDVVYTDGDDFHELEGLVGRAVELFSFDDGTATATWWSNTDDISVHVSITYVQETGMIIEKVVWGTRW